MKGKISKRIFALLCATCMLVSSVGVWLQAKAQNTLETLNPDFEQVTFSNWGFADDTYSTNGDVRVGREYTGSLDGKVFSGYVTFNHGSNNEEEAAIYIGGPGVWGGMILQSKFADGTLVLYVGGDEYTFDSTTAGVPLLDNRFNLKLSYEVVSNSLKLGVWFNNKLYNNEYITVTKGNRGEGTYEYYLTGEIELYSGGAASLTIASDVPGTVETQEILDSAWGQVSFSDWGLANDTYSTNGDVCVGRAYTESLAGKVFSGNVTFNHGSNNEEEAAIYIGGPGVWSGMILQSKFADGTLVLTAGGETYTFDSTTAGVTLLDNKFNLKLSYEVVGSALQLGVWFNNKLYNNEYITITKGNGGEGTYEYYLTGEIELYSGGAASLTIESDILKELNSALEQVSFNNWGLANDTYSTNGDVYVGRAYTESLSGKVFSGNVTFNHGSNNEEEAAIYIGGPGVWGGMILQSKFADGTLVLTAGGETYTFHSHIARVQLLDNAFNLKLSYEVVGDALQLGVWFNNILYNNEYITITKGNGGEGTYEYYLTGEIELYSGGTASITIQSDEPPAPDTPDTPDIPETLPELDYFSFIDFGWQDGVYSNLEQGYYGYGDSFENKMFWGDVKFSSNYAAMYLGGAEKGIWAGLSLASGQNDGSLTFNFDGHSHKIDPQTAIGADSLADTLFDLKISYELVDRNDDGVNELKLGLWFNDTLYDNEYFYCDDYAHYLQGGLMISAPGGVDGSGIVTIASKSVPVEAPEVLDSSLEVITFRDFGIDNGRYNFTGDFAITGGFDGTLEGKVFSGDVTFSSKPTHLFIGGEPSLWYGISLASGQAEYTAASELRLIIGDQVHVLKPAIAGVQLVGETYNLKLSYQVVDTDNDGKKDSLKFGVWFNDKLYNNEYFYVSTYESSQEGCGTYQDFLAARIGIYPEIDGSSMKVKSVGTEVLNPNLQFITFNDFGISDDSYTYVGDLAAIGSYDKSLAEKVICGDVQFSAQPATLFVGGEPDVKNGMSITSGADGNLTLKLGDNEYVLTPEIAETTLVGKSFNLKLSYQVIDDDGDGQNDTLQIGVWINDKLYANDYFYVSTYGTNRTYTDYLTGKIAVYPTTEGASLKLISDKPKVMDTSLEKITFADFSISDDTYKGKVGFYRESLVGKVFSGNVTFSNVRSDIWIGGPESFWEGMGFLSGYKGDTTTLRLLAGGREYIFTPEIAGTTLVGEEFNLKLSYQLVDRDGDGTKELQLGVWFNDKLYNNQYIYIANYANYIGGYLGIYTEGEGAYVKVASDLLIDNPALGSRRAPSPNTGDTENVVLYISLAVFAMMVICVFVKKRHLGFLAEEA